MCVGLAVQKDGFEGCEKVFRYMIALVNCPCPDSRWKGVGISIQELGSDVEFIDSCISDHLLLAHPKDPIILHPQ